MSLAAMTQRPAPDPVPPKRTASYRSQGKARACHAPRIPTCPHRSICWTAASGTRGWSRRRCRTSWAWTLARLPNETELAGLAMAWRRSSVGRPSDAFAASSRSDFSSTRPRVCRFEILSKPRPSRAVCANSRGDVAAAMTDQGAGASTAERSRPSPQTQHHAPTPGPSRQSSPSRRASPQVGLSPLVAQSRSRTSLDPAAEPSPLQPQTSSDADLLQLASSNHLGRASKPTQDTHGKRDPSHGRRTSAGDAHGVDGEHHRQARPALAPTLASSADELLPQGIAEYTLVPSRILGAGKFSKVMLAMKDGRKVGIFGPTDVLVADGCVPHSTPSSTPRSIRTTSSSPLGSCENRTSSHACRRTRTSSECTRRSGRLVTSTLSRRRWTTTSPSRPSSPLSPKAVAYDQPRQRES